MSSQQHPPNRSSKGGPCARAPPHTVLELHPLAPHRDTSWREGLLRGPPRVKTLTLQFLACLRGPSRLKVLQLQFFAALRGPSRIKVLQLQFYAALRGPSRPFVDKGVAVALLSLSPRPQQSKTKIQ